MTLGQFAFRIGLGTCDATLCMSHTLHSALESGHKARIAGDPLLLLIYTSELFSTLEYKLLGYADDSTLIAVVPSQGARVTVAESLSRGLVKASEWCDLWRMK